MRWSRTYSGHKGTLIMSGHTQRVSSFRASFRSCLTAKILKIYSDRTPLGGSDAFNMVPCRSQVRVSGSQSWHRELINELRGNRFCRLHGSVSKLWIVWLAPWVFPNLNLLRDELDLSRVWLMLIHARSPLLISASESFTWSASGSWASYDDVTYPAWCNIRWNWPADALSYVYILGWMK